MNKVLNALALGIEILSDVELLLSGSGTSFTFSWHGKKFVVNVDPS